MIHCYILNDRIGLPDCFLLEGYHETNGIMIFGTIEGEGFTQYKVGNELNADPHLMLKLMK